MKTSRSIARGSILAALGVALIYVSIVSPTSKIYILGVASSLIPLSVILTDTKTSLLVYLSTSILSFLIFGFKGSVLGYIIFFGLYGLVKYYIEKLRNMLMEIIFKLLFFNFSFCAIYFLYKLFLTNLIKINLPLFEVAIMLQFVFIIFDYALTIFISYASKMFGRLHLV